MKRYNDWMTYSFDGILNSPKTSRRSFLDLHFNIPNDIGPMSYHDALIKNASIMRDSFSEPFDVLLSGGIDSEVMIRTFKDLGITHNTFVFRYEDNLNIRDVNSSIQICEALNIPYKIIDFNLSNFYEQDAKDMFEKTLVPDVASLSRIKWLDYLDNIPVFGEGEPYWKRELRGDYTKKSNWSLYLTERQFFISLTSHYHHREIIGEWYLYTPYITMNYHSDPMIQNLLDDKTVGKESTLSSRLPLHRTFWPDIKDKSKLTGYEGPTGKPLENPPSFFRDFYIENQMADLTNVSFTYSVEEVNKIFKGI
jgi:Queuosine biosynthesis protein QueC